MRLVWIAVVVSLGAPARAGSGFGMLIPPAEVDVGVGAPVGQAAAVGPSTEVLAGLHWASLYWKPTRFDVGVGYVGSFRRVEPAALARADPPASDDHVLRLHGGYFDVSYALAGEQHWRTWLSARGELFHAQLDHHAFSAMGAVLRVAAEVFGQHVQFGGGHKFGAGIAGTFALGLYVEASVRDLPSQLGRDQVTAGLTLRLPFLVAAGS